MEQGHSRLTARLPTAARGPLVSAPRDL
jgi:hypothetical protein